MVVGKGRVGVRGREGGRGSRCGRRVEGNREKKGKEVVVVAGSGRRRERGRRW